MDENRNHNSDLSLDDETDALIELLAELLGKQKEDQAKYVWLSDFERENEFDRAIEGLIRITRGDELKITYETHKLLIGSGAISITGKNIEFTKPALFAGFAKLADNIETYPRTDGTVRLDLTFHKLARRIGEI